MSLTALLDGLTRLPKGLVPIVNPPSRKSAKHSPISIQNRVRVNVVGKDEAGNDVTKLRTPWYDNILTTYGLASLASAFGSAAAVTASAWIQAIYIGTGVTAPVSTDSKLANSTASVTIGNASFTKTNTGALTIEYRAAFASSNPAGTYVAGELGLYCNSTGNETQNNMACHATLATTVTKAASDVLQVSYQVVFTTA